MKKSTRRLAEILGIDRNKLNDLLNEAKYPRYAEKQLVAAVDKLDKYDLFSRMNTLNLAREAAERRSEAFWRRVARTGEVNLLSVALSTEVPVSELRRTERALGRELTTAERDEWIAKYRLELFDYSAYAYDEKCPMCGRFGLLDTCRACGVRCCVDCTAETTNALGSRVSRLVCKNCVGKLPNGW